MESNLKINKKVQTKHLKLQISYIEPKFIHSVQHETTTEKLKTELNKTKSKLDKYYELSKVDSTFKKQWLKFQNTVDIYKPMRWYIENTFNAKHVTNAWMKYYEIYTEYNLVDAKSKYVAFFNAELPGAALCAFNHFMKTRNLNFTWYGSSYISNDLSTFGDFYGLYANNKNNWLMTDDNNGDMTCIDNILDIANKIGPNSPISGVDFYSHDAGMDVSSDFNNQELINAKLHLGCALAGFLTMKIGACFIAKQYTFFEKLTLDLIMIYSQLFNEFYICKPLTSRPYNSEIYLIGKGFKGFDDATKKVLIDKLVNFNTEPLLDTVYNMEIFNFAELVFMQQIDFINENIYLLEKYKNDNWLLNRQIEPIRNKSINNWLRKYPIFKISDSNQIDTFCKNKLKN
ncbi:FtsJ-like methyltransferase [Pacmanvirus A23]|uniref:FtsJ-like methyltransferase n=1 Tax=Pacmanvirus A23 TaxID=1932881 RepID=UPI000A09214A|nr:FtsJ-like methyltransferase [Pacmanvirus A23]SIP85802.1 FtsJ-like methyltransferase [Pacmanvirus A23]